MNEPLEEPITPIIASGLKSMVGTLWQLQNRKTGLGDRPAFEGLRLI